MTKIPFNGDERITFEFNVSKYPDSNVKGTYTELVITFPLIVESQYDSEDFERRFESLLNDLEKEGFEIWISGRNSLKERAAVLFKKIELPHSI